LAVYQLFLEHVSLSIHNGNPSTSHTHTHTQNLSKNVCLIILSRA